MASRYCRIHPNVALDWLGDCPRCASEKESKRIQSRLVEEQQVANRMMQLAHEENRILQQKLISEQEATRALLERQEEEQRALRDREKIQVGIVEFEDDFQEEWNQVAKRFKSLNVKKDEIDSILDSRLSQEFTRDFKEENLSEIVRQEADNILDVTSFNEKLLQYNEIVKKNSKQQEMDIKHGSSANAIGNIIASYINQKTYSNGTAPGGGLGLLIFGAFPLLLGLSGLISRIMGNHNVYIPLAILLTTTGLIFFFVGLISSRSRSSELKQQNRIGEAFNGIASILSPRFLGKDWILGKEVLARDYRNLDSLLRIAFYTIKEAHRMAYYNELISENSQSSAGREVYSIISSLGNLAGFYDFLNLYGEYESKYSYMREAIIEIGDDIQNGHRVPSSMKKRRIALMKCPSCGGPLAADSSKTCHYCGSSFERY